MLQDIADLEVITQLHQLELKYVEMEFLLSVKIVMMTMKVMVMDETQHVLLKLDILELIH